MEDPHPTHRTSSDHPPWACGTATDASIQIPPSKHIYTAASDTYTTLEEPLVEHAIESIETHLQSGPFAVCLDTHTAAAELRERLVHSGLFGQARIDIYYTTEAGQQVTRLTKTPPQTTPREMYRTAFEWFLDTQMLTEDGATIPRSECYDRFATWYRNLTGQKAPDRTWVGPLLDTYLQGKRVAGEERQIVDRRWRE